MSEKKGELPRTTRVKNKQPADKQITAEQLLREAKEIQLEDDYKAPKQIITDPEELAEYRLSKRKQFEDLVRRVGRFNGGVWVKYATWEEQQKDFRRARSVWERCLAIEYRNVSMWLKYAEMEMRHRFVNHARNVWDRAVSLLPRVDQLWYKYIHMEEMLGNVAGARQVFERWMRFEPDHTGWMAYIKFELRYNEVERARAIFERYVQILPTVKAWVRYAKFEMQNGEVGLARRCYERAVEELGEDAQTEEFFIKFAEFEEKAREVERARSIYRYALDHIPKASAPSLYQRFVAFEKQHGDREGIEQVVVSKRRFQYEEDIAKSPYNYDTWFDYIKLEEGTGDIERTREVYERAVAQLPPSSVEKRFWRRYIYLWVKYALFEELDCADPDRTRDVYRAVLDLIPHRTFTFAKAWIMAAKFEIRQRNLEGFRKLLGRALGLCPKEKLFKAYIELELTMGNVDRVRKLYEKYLEWRPSNVGAWVRFADLERQLGETGRARALYELAIGQPLLDMPEALWKSYIDFEIAEGERERVRVLYTRLLDRTKHVKVWLSFARFEANPMPTPGEEGEDGQPAEAPAEGPESAPARAARARSVYERAFSTLRDVAPDSKEEAVLLLEAWRDFEREQAASSEADRAARVAEVEKKMPRRVKRKRPVTTEDGHEVGQEEYYDYIFPEEGAAAPGLKLLEAAYRWKRQRQGAAPGDEPQQRRGGGGGAGAGAGQEAGGPSASDAAQAFAAAAMSRFAAAGDGGGAGAGDRSGSEEPQQQQQQRVEEERREEEEGDEQGVERAGRQARGERRSEEEAGEEEEGRERERERGREDEDEDGAARAGRPGRGQSGEGGENGEGPGRTGGNQGDSPAQDDSQPHTAL
ncbi:hypothetical protein HYH02_007413 [Chlamydomonas schloesseri]|uniref:Crooked neck protein n=1 Tax=Chlamydomonas schloesseri TaxID=2026947 RepID=A0A836B4I9_9CHLO|nr:hypothetical protein HYH02_007413 [Chlamydomonas schloesseri]|eukprot:KAG2447486.1 hypothetical protein HYH02_007413 [Chlamydomonas schloesseri]